MTGSAGFPGERPEHHMRKLAVSNRAVTCASCRQFDGTAWCRRWNYHTEPEAPICGEYRPRALVAQESLLDMDLPDLTLESVEEMRQPRHP